MEGNIATRKIIGRTFLFCAGLAIAATIIVPSVGCMGVMSQVMWVLKGHDVQPKFPGLEKKRVAVVCVSDQSTFGPDSVTISVARMLSANLLKNVKDIEIIPQSKIENWKDSNGWGDLDELEIGKGVNADMVVWVEIPSFSIHEGSTMLKGRAQITTNVFDINKGGSLVFTSGEEEFVYPRDGRPSLQISERDFESKYIEKLAVYIGQNFCKHDQYNKVESNSNF